MTASYFTRIVALVDRSGSMATNHDATIHALNSFLDELKAAPGEATFKCVEFDSDYNMLVDTPLFRARHFTMKDCVPRGATALNDALGRTIDELGKELSALAESDRPGKVIILVITDGMENASRYYSHDQVRAMTKHQQEKYGWEFRYVGANQNAEIVGTSYGIPRGSTITYAANAAGINNVMHAVAQSVNSARTRGIGGQSMAAYSFTEDDRKQALIDVDLNTMTGGLPGTGTTTAQTMNNTTTSINEALANK